MAGLSAWGLSGCLGLSIIDIIIIRLVRLISIRPKTFVRLFLIGCPQKGQARALGLNLARQVGQGCICILGYVDHLYTMLILYDLVTRRYF